MSALGQAWERLQAQWRGNARLRAGGAIIGVILALWLLLSLSDWKAASASAYGDESARLQKIRALSGQTVWLQRAEAARKLERALEAEIPSAKTAGLAQAAFQTQLGELVRRSGGVLRVQVSPANSDTGVPDVWRVPATIDGEISLPQIQQVLHELETSPNLITIETLTLTNRDKVRLSTSVQAYYRLPAGEVAHAP